MIKRKEKKIVQKGKVKMPQVVLMFCLQLVVLLSDLMYYAVMSSLCKSGSVATCGTAGYMVYYLF